MTTELDLGWLEPSLGGLQRRDPSSPSTGLSRAIAERLGVDPVIVRVVFISLAFCAGLGVALYVWGTGLTRGPRGTRPIDQVLPGFRSWSTGAQKTAFVVSTIIFVAICAPVFPLQWGAGVLVLLALLVWRRRARRVGGVSRVYGPSATSAAWDAPSVDGVGDDALVEHWRASISQAAGTPRHLATTPGLLPEVNLYSHDDTLAPRTAEPALKANWWAGATILGTMALTSLLTYLVLGFAGDTAVAVSTAAGGLVMVLFALALRRRRVPPLAVVAVAVSAVFSGWLAVQTTSLPVEVSPDIHTVSVVAEEAVVDLTTMDLTAYSTVRVDALLADVEIILPASIEEVSIDSFAAEVTDRRRGRTPVDETETLPVEVQISAKLSNVTIKEQP